MTSPYRAFFSESLSLVGAQGVIMVARVGTAILIARGLGPERYGEFAYALSIVLIFAGLCGLGLNRPVLRLAVENRAEDNVLFPTAFALELIVTSLAALGLAAVDVATGGPGLLTLMAPMLVLGASNVFVPWYQGQQRYRAIVRLDALGYVLTGLIVIALFVTGGTAIQFGLAMVFTTAFTAWVVLGNRPRELRADRASVLRDLVPNSRELLTAAWPFLLNDVIFLTMARADQVLLRRLAGAEQLGYYVVATRLTEFSALFPSLVATAFAPVLAQLRTRGEEFADHALHQVYIGVLIAGLLCSTALVVLREPLIRVLFGAKYLPSMDVIAIHAWVCAPAFLTALRVQWVVLHGHQNRFLIAGFVSAGVQLALLGVLVPRYGAQGAALAYIVGVCTNLYVAPLLLGPAIARHTWTLLRAFDVTLWPGAIRTLARVAARRTAG